MGEEKMKGVERRGEVMSGEERRESRRERIRGQDIREENQRESERIRAVKQKANRWKCCVFSV